MDNQERETYDHALEAYAADLVDLQAESERRLGLLKRCKPWLVSYLEYLDTDIPLLGEPNNTVDKLIDELTKELGDE